MRDSFDSDSSVSEVGSWVLGGSASSRSVVDLCVVVDTASCSTSDSWVVVGNTSSTSIADLVCESLLLDCRKNILIVY